MKTACLIIFASTLLSAQKTVNYIPISSTDFGSGYWTFVNLAVHPNATVAPDGSMAQGLDDVVMPNADPGAHFLYGQTTPQNLPVPDFNHVCFSVFLKAGTHSIALIDLQAFLNAADPSGNVSYLGQIHVDLAAGVIFNAAGYTSNVVPFITDAGNGWFRVGVGIKPVFPHQRFVSVFPRIAPLNNNGQISYFSAGDSNVLFVWGAQIDKGTTPLPYQPVP